MEGLSLVVPVYNGEKVIEKSLKDYYNAFYKKFKNFEIIAVLNGCTDNSVEICQKLAGKYPLKLIVLRQKGKGRALVKGFNEARFSHIGFIDQDNPFNLEDISKMVDKLKYYDVVIATKYLRGKARSRESLSRRFISLGGSFFSRVILNLKFRDTQAGAKFFRKQVWEKIDNNFITTGFDFDMEFLYKVSKKRFRILECYTPYPSEKFTTVRLKYLPGMIFRLLKLRFFG